MATAPVTEAPSLEELRFRLGFFKLNVCDLDRLTAFYRDTFGMEERNRIALPDLEEIVLAMPSDQFTLVLLAYKDGRAHEMGTGYGPVGFLTRHVDGAIDRVVAHGGTLVRGPFDLPGMRLAFVADPEGHGIELMQFVRPPAQEQVQ